MEWQLKQNWKQPHAYWNWFELLLDQAGRQAVCLSPRPPLVCVCASLLKALT